MSIITITIDRPGADGQAIGETVTFTTNNDDGFTHASLVVALQHAEELMKFQKYDSAARRYARFWDSYYNANATREAHALIDDEPVDAARESEWPWRPKA